MAAATTTEPLPSDSSLHGTARRRRPPARHAKETRTSAFARLRPWHVECVLVVLIPAAVQLILGWHLSNTTGALPVDAMARVQNATAVIAGRDPHPEAMGFVWGPFPTLFEVPFTALRTVWPALTHAGMAGVVISALFLGLTLWVVDAWMHDLGLPRTLRLLLVAAVWLHPLVLVLGASGMSETTSLFFLVAAARETARWWETHRFTHLVAAGSFVAFGYLTRYEVAAAAVLFIALVAYEAYSRATGERRERLRRGVLVGLLAGLAPIAAVSVWAAYSWLIVGEPFAQLTSTYGNSAQVASAAKDIAEVTGGAAGLPRVGFFVRQVVAVGPALLFLAPALLWFGARGAKRVVAALVMLGAPLAVQLVGAYAGSTFHWIRFTVTAVPLGVLLAGVLLANLRTEGYLRRGTQILAAAGVLACVVLPFVTATRALHQGKALGAREEGFALTGVPGPYRAGQELQIRSMQKVTSQIAADIDRLEPGVGEVLTDSATTAAVIDASTDPAVYRITQDRDFEQSVAAPADFGVRYVLVPSPRGGAMDAVARLHPTLFETPGPNFRLVYEWGDDDAYDLHFRLYEILDRGKR